MTIRPLQDSPKLTPSIGEQAAKASWLAPMVVIVMNGVIRKLVDTHTVNTATVIAFASFGLYLLGLALGIYALTTVRIFGAKGIRTPAIIGVTMNAVLILILGFVAIVTKIELG